MTHATPSLSSPSRPRLSVPSQAAFLVATSRQFIVLMLRFRSRPWPKSVGPLSSPTIEGKVADNPPSLSFGLPSSRCFIHPPGSHVMCKNCNRVITQAGARAEFKPPGSHKISTRSVYVKVPSVELEISHGIILDSHCMQATGRYMTQACDRRPLITSITTSKYFQTSTYCSALLNIPETSLVVVTLATVLVTSQMNKNADFNVQ